MFVPWADGSGGSVVGGGIIGVNRCGEDLSRDLVRRDSSE